MAHWHKPATRFDVLLAVCAAVASILGVGALHSLMITPAATAVASQAVDQADLRAADRDAATSEQLQTITELLAAVVHSLHLRSSWMQAVSEVTGVPPPTGDRMAAPRMTTNSKDADCEQP